MYCALSNHQNNSSPSHYHYFYGNLDELRDPYFQKVGRYVPQNPRGYACGRVTRITVEELSFVGRKGREGYQNYSGMGRNCFGDSKVHSRPTYAVAKTLTL